MQYPCEYSVTAVHEIPDSKKNQKSVVFESPVSQQVAVPVRSRSTHGHAAIRDANSQFVCDVHVFNYVLA